ncbi:MAG: phasin family protein [Rhodospirillales bacterium]|nr:phasin family protein [Rhodospirillales bacterium]MDP6644904.1 phasin family protein [Rhodospirillales bacterium]
MTFIPTIYFAAQKIVSAKRIEMMTAQKKTTQYDAAEQAVNAALDAAENLAAQGAEAVDAAIATSEDALKEGWDKTQAYADEQAAAFKNGFGQAANLAQDNLTAAFSAAKQANQGWNAYTQQVMDYTKKAFAENVTMAGKFAAAKTPDEFISLQSEAADKAVNRVSAQARKLNDIALKSAAKTVQPLNKQYEKNLDTFAN